MPKALTGFVRNRYAFSLFLLSAIYVVGIITGISGYADDLMLLTPYNLLFVSFIILYNAQEINRKYLLWFTTIALAGYLIELIGVKTGIIFGEYAYGKGLGVKLFDVPLIIGLNWAILVFSTAALLEKLSWPVWTKASASASLMVAYDLLLEPIAIRFDFWTWAGGSIPIQNYMAWWVIAFLMHVLILRNVSNLRNRLAIWVILIQVVFFITLLVSQKLSIH